MNDAVLHMYVQSVFGEYAIIDEKRIRFPKLSGGLSELFKDLGIHLLFIWSKNCRTDYLVTDKGKYLIFDLKMSLYMNALTSPDVFRYDDQASFEDIMFEAIAYIAAGELLFKGHPKMCAYINEQYVKNFFYNIPVHILQEINKMVSVLLHEWGHYIGKTNDKVLLENMNIVENTFNEFCDDKARMYFKQKNYNKSMWYDMVYRRKFKENKVHIECCADLFGFEHALWLTRGDELFKALSGGIDKYVYDSLVSIHQMIVIDCLRKIVDSAINGREYDFKENGVYDQRLRITRDILCKRLINEVGFSDAEKCYKRFTEYYIRNDDPIIDMLKDLHRIIYQNRDSFNESEDALVVNEKCLKLYTWPPHDLG